MSFGIVFKADSIDHCNPDYSCRGSGEGSRSVSSRVLYCIVLQHREGSGPSVSSRVPYCIVLQQQEEAGLQYPVVYHTALYWQQRDEACRQYPIIFRTVLYCSAGNDMD